MSVRLLLAVVVATALLASSLPAVDAARTARAEYVLSESTQRTHDAMVQLPRRNDPVPPGVPGARRQVAVSLPPDGAGSLRIGDGGDSSQIDDDRRSDVLVYQVDGENPHVRRLETDVRVVRNGVIQSDDTALVLRRDSVLTLRYVRLDGVPTILVTRGFKSSNRTNPAHVRIPS